MKRYELVVGEHRLLTIDELGRVVDLHPELLHRYVVFGLIDPEIDQPEPLFSDDIVSRIAKIERLRHDLGVNLAGCGLVLDLLERIDQLEDEIRLLRGMW